jgi:aryl-alcohol dehydrogenase-like predicted oxidoreductase
VGVCRKRKTTLPILRIDGEKNDDIEKKQLGNSNLEITRIGFGAWAIGGSWEWGWGTQEDQQSIDTIHRALEMGINWIDTAPVYGLGRSEAVIAKALKQTSYQPYIFTKCGLVWNQDKEISNALNSASVEAEVDASLKRLDVETIDLYQIHWPNPDGEIEEAFETMAEMQKKGKIHYLAVSNFSPEQMDRVSKIAEITSNQPPYSLAFPQVEEDVLPYCQDNNIGVIGYSPMASGLLSGKMTRERIANLDESDWRRRGDEFKEPRLTRNLALVELLKEIGERHSTTAGEVAIAWTLLHPAVTGAIVGLRRPDQVDGIIRAGELQFSAEDIRQIKDFRRESP